MYTYVCMYVCMYVCNTSLILSSGMSHRYMSRPLIAFSDEAMSTDFPFSMELGTITSV